MRFLWCFHDSFQHILGISDMQNAWQFQFMMSEFSPTIFYSHKRVWSSFATGASPAWNKSSTTSLDTYIHTQSQDLADSRTAQRNGRHFSSLFFNSNFEICATDSHQFQLIVDDIQAINYVLTEQYAVSMEIDLLGQLPANDPWWVSSTIIDTSTAAVGETYGEFPLCNFPHSHNIQTHFIAKP